MVFIKDEETFLKRLIKFYTKPAGRSVFALFYLIIFFYFIIFFFDNLFLAIRFIFYTLFVSTITMNASDLILGASFLVFLIAPFVLSLFGLILPLLIKEKRMPKPEKWSRIVILGLILILSLILMDMTLGYIQRHEPISLYLEKRGIPFKYPEVNLASPARSF